MNGQVVLVSLVVAACAAYAVWTLAPRAVRRRVAGALLGRAWPERIERLLQRHARTEDGCACDGCDAAEAKVQAKARAPGAARPITFHPRRPR